MSSPETRRPWTLCGLVKAFVDLALAYLLLCASTFAFFASLFLSVLGLRLPCPCRGIFGYRNADLCWHRVLVDWPVGKIHEVQALANSRFAFRDVVSGPRNQNLVGERESGSEVKGKSRAVNPKLKSGIRRRRRASSLAYGKFAGDGLARSVDLVHKLGESSGILSGHEYGPQDDADPPRGVHDPSGLESGPEAERIRTLERALDEARSACSALYAELEKERAAAASAADEAVAMICRLQSDRASMEVEARQLERLIDERFAHDEDEIGALKEILFMRERDNLFLEKEIESYRRMIVAGDEYEDEDEDETFVEKRSPCESVEKTVILVDHGDRAVMLDSVSEDTNDGHYIVALR